MRPHCILNLLEPKLQSLLAARDLPIERAQLSNVADEQEVAFLGIHPDGDLRGLAEDMDEALEPRGCLLGVVERAEERV